MNLFKTRAAAVTSARSRLRDPRCDEAALRAIVLPCCHCVGVGNCVQGGVCPQIVDVQPIVLRDDIVRAMACSV
jgi:hypothetical protein